MSLEWFPWFPEDFRRDTLHLTLEEDGAYRRLIDHYMITRAPLPADDNALARILGIPKADWDRLAVKVRRFFRMRNDKLWHKRCECELRAQNARKNRNSERGKKAAFAKYSKISNLVNPSMLAPPTLTQERNNSYSENSAARARAEIPVKKNEPAGSFATAPWGALARQPITEQAAAAKPPSSMSRAELAALYAGRRANGGGHQ